MLLLRCVCRIFQMVEFSCKFTFFERAFTMTSDQLDEVVPALTLSAALWQWNCNNGVQAFMLTLSIGWCQACVKIVHHD